MTITIVAGARTVFAVCVLALVTATGAGAGDAYWHGSRSTDWSDGVQGSVSNWYARPPHATPNTPLPVPTTAAIFAPGARNHAVVVTGQVRIEEMVFTPGDFFPGTGQYGIGVGGFAGLTVTGRGLINRSTVAPSILLAPYATMRFTNAARIVSGSGSIQITSHGGSLHFWDTSKGGDATVSNTHSGDRYGTVLFLGRSSAGSMIIANAGKTGLAFFDHSSAGDADLANNYDFSAPLEPQINFRRTRGPAGDHKLTAGSIANNFGSVIIGENQITVLRTFTQGANGTLEIDVIGSRAGAVRVKGPTRIDGTLVVKTDNPRIGRYVILRPTGGRRGLFSRVRYTGLPATLKGRITYLGTDVVLFIERR
jgi:hypothetical protein